METLFTKGQWKPTGDEKHPVGRRANTITTAKTEGTRAVHILHTDRPTAVGERDAVAAVSLA